jgi:mannose-6-phosphate isomerase-like protein (cupin superfamily)
VGAKCVNEPSPSGAKEKFSGAGNSRAALDRTAEGGNPYIRAKGPRVTNSKAHFFTLNEIDAQRAAGNKLYQEFLRVPAMSAGVYVLPAGGTDPQRPHHEDEMYYVVRGRARFRAGDEDREVSAGTVLFVAAEVEHRFYDIEEELAVLVFFAPAES